MKKTPFRILKLKSGDDVIARLIANSKESIKLERPMYLKFMHFVDNSSGMKRETLVLVDWLKTTTSNHIEIPKDHILGIFDPDPDIARAYDLQKRMDDNPQDMMNHLKRTGQMNFPFMNEPEQQKPNIDNILKIVAAKIDSMREQVEEDTEDAIESMFERMGIDFDEDDPDVKIIKDDKDSPDYGTRYWDWSPNVDDYLT